MSEQYRCNKCGCVIDISEFQCSECVGDAGKFEKLRWTKGGHGSHWEGCADVHWDCRIAQLEAELARLKEENHALDQINRDMRTASDHLDEVLDELVRRDEELKITDGLLKEATVTIGAVIACCTYNSNDDAKIGVYGIDQNAFTRIDQFITHYNDAVSAGKVSVDVKPVKRDLSDAEIEELGAQEAEKRGDK